MSEEQSQTRDDHKKVQRAEHKAGQPGAGLEGFSCPEGVHAYPATLLGDPRLNGRGNAPVKIAMMRQMQQTYGNRALQRALQRQIVPETVEEKRLQKEVPQDILETSRFNAAVIAFKNEVMGAMNLKETEEAVRKHGSELWKAATDRAQGKGPKKDRNVDDRPLYWARLGMTRVLRQETLRFGPTDKERLQLVQLLEQTSRGMTGINFAGGKNGAKRILISGFDPFDLATRIEQRNMSGAAALALDGQEIEAGGITARIESVVFPVRFADFDERIVERTFSPYLTGENHVDMIMTISLGSDNFEVERWAGRRRSSGDFPDNLGEKRGTYSNPVEPGGINSGPEFLETTLPAPDIRKALGRDEPDAGEIEFTEIRPEDKNHPVTVRNKDARPTAGSTAVRGSGGGFLSNEIFYRTRLLTTEEKVEIPVGHLHVPTSDSKMTPKRIVDKVEEILRAALKSLGTAKK